MYIMGPLAPSVIDYSQHRQAEGLVWRCLANCYRMGSEGWAKEQRQIQEKILGLLELFLV